MKDKHFLCKNNKDKEIDLRKIIFKIERTPHEIIINKKIEGASIWLILQKLFDLSQLT